MGATTGAFGVVEAQWEDQELDLALLEGGGEEVVGQLVALVVMCEAV